MNTTYILLAALSLTSIFSSCSDTQPTQPVKADTVQTVQDNAEIKDMVQTDQQMRIEGKPGLEEQDEKHRKRIFELIANGEVRTPKVEGVNQAAVIDLCICTRNRFVKLVVVV